MPLGRTTFLGGTLQSHWSLDDRADHSELPPSGALSNLVVYDSNCRDTEFLLIGDSIIRTVGLPRGITYCFSGARTLNIVENIPPVPDRHPTVHTVIIHRGTNDIKLRQSTKLQQHFEMVAVTIESLGKQ